MHLRSLIDSLSQAASVIIPGQIFLGCMRQMMSVPKCQHRRKKQFQSDVQWWACFLLWWNGRTILLPPQAVHSFWSNDSGTWGCGALSDTKHWFQVQWPESRATRQAYASGQQRYMQLCANAGLQPLPLVEQTLCIFMAQLAREGVVHPTIKSYLSAIQHFVILQGQIDPFQGDPFPLLQYVLNGVRVHHQAPRQPRMPIAPATLWSLWISLERDIPCCGPYVAWASFGFMQAGEFVVAQANGHRPLCVFRKLQLTVSKTSRHPGILETDPLHKDVTIYPGRTHADICPVAAVLAFVAIRPVLPIVVSDDRAWPALCSNRPQPVPSQPSWILVCMHKLHSITAAYLEPGLLTRVAMSTLHSSLQPWLNGPAGRTAIRTQIVVSVMSTGYKASGFKREWLKGRKDWFMYDDGKGMFCRLCMKWNKTPCTWFSIVSHKKSAAHCDSVKLELASTVTPDIINAICLPEIPSRETEQAFSCLTFLAKEHTTNYQPMLDFLGLNIKMIYALQKCHLRQW